jgi:hypothetical protein
MTTGRTVASVKTNTVVIGGGCRASYPSRSHRASLGATRASQSVQWLPGNLALCYRLRHSLKYILAGPILLLDAIEHWGARCEGVAGSSRRLFRSWSALR